MIRGYVAWVDWLIYGGLAVVSAAITVFIVFMAGHWDVLVVAPLSIALVVTSIVAAIVLAGKFLSCPNYVERHGVAVWTGGIPPAEEQERFERSLYILIRALPEMTKSFPLGSAERNLKRRHIRGMLKGVRMEWRLKPFTKLTRWGWAAKDEMCLQKNARMLVQWKIIDDDSALYHAFLHMIDKRLFKRTDYAHTNEPWWALTVELKKLAETQNAIS